jgi:DGQHR domain-containing protein
MNLYPAIKARMGTWNYFIVKMMMKDIVKEVGFASEMYSNKTLDDALQRTLNEGRVKKEIVKYLAKRDDRFFASIVVAALGGNPTFYGVDITEDPQFKIFRDQSLDEAFGILTFDGGQKYFALDGQHRLKAIQTLVEGTEKDTPDMPEGFLEEEVSVIMLVRSEESDEKFLQMYRRVFSSLNRYAKPTDRDTNIIMDEDDAIAILTRRLLTEHEFFLWQGKAADSPKLKTKGKNMKSGEAYFTTLQTLYGMNEFLLETPDRENHGYGTAAYKQVRPSEEELDALFDELTLYWNALLEAMPVLKEDPTVMRDHTAASEETEETTDNLLFWPIGQELFAKVSRSLLTRQLPDVDNPTHESACEIIKTFDQLNWNLHRPPWYGLLITQNADSGAWKMRSEDRKLALNVAERIIRWKIGLDDLQDDGIEELRIEWHALLLPRPTKEEAVAKWRSI